MGLPPRFGRVLLLVILVGTLVGGGAYTFFYAQGISYFSKNPEACANCHIMHPQYDSWMKSSHQPVARCADCHLPSSGVHQYVAKADNGFRHAWAFTFQTFHEPIQIIPRNQRILQNQCIECHGQFVHAILDEDNGPGCVRCHASVGHGPPK